MDNEQDRMLEKEERRIRRVLDEAGITLSERAWNILWGCVWYGNTYFVGTGLLTEDEERSLVAALDALGESEQEEPGSDTLPKRTERN